MSESLLSVYAGRHRFKAFKKEENILQMDQNESFRGVPGSGSI
jgi:hypothetical protein